MRINYVSDNCTIRLGYKEYKVRPDDTKLGSNLLSGFARSTSWGSAVFLACVVRRVDPISSWASQLCGGALGMLTYPCLGLVELSSRFTTFSVRF